MRCRLRHKSRKGVNVGTANSREIASKATDFLGGRNWCLECISPLSLCERGVCIPVVCDFGAAEHSFLNFFYWMCFRCREIFDFSDHVVLFVVQYICVVSLEYVAVILQPTASKLQQIAVLVPTLVITAVALWYMTMTAAYFHTQLETIVGLVLAVGFALAVFGGLAFASKQPGKLRRIASQMFTL